MKLEAAMKKKKAQSEAPLDILYADLVRSAGFRKDSSLLDICLHGTQREITAVPLRYRLIALGFVKKLSPEEVNLRLLENGCPRLYARSFWEASVIYAFRKGLSYAQWKELTAQCEDMREKIASGRRAFSGRTISLSDIRRYVNGNSLRKSDLYTTLHATNEMEQKLTALAENNEPKYGAQKAPESRASAAKTRCKEPIRHGSVCMSDTPIRKPIGIKEEGEQDSGQTEFLEFLRSNLSSFSTAREKARYYFCKYLLYDLDSRKNACLGFMKREMKRTNKEAAGLPSDPVLLQDLRVFKVHSSLKRKQHTAEDADIIVENAALSLKNIYEFYSHFYFDYPFRDWIRILAENGTDPLTLPPDAQRTLADAVRKNAIRRGSLRRDALRESAILGDALPESAIRRDTEEEMPKDGSDAAFLAWLQEEFQHLEEQDWEEGKTSYQSDREGENFLRKVLRGTLDLDRTTLLSFLLYFGTTARSDIPAAHRIERERINGILEESGFPVLDPSLPFDRFVCRFLESPDPQSFLVEEAEQMALSGKNFYLHRGWLHAASAEEQWGRMT